MPVSTFVKVTLSFVAYVILPFASCFTVKLLPATISTVLLGLINSPSSLVPVSFSPPSADVFKLNPALLIASATFCTVATLFNPASSCAFCAASTGVCLAATSAFLSATACCNAGSFGSAANAFSASFKASLAADKSFSAAAKVSFNCLAVAGSAGVAIAPVSLLSVPTAGFISPVVTFTPFSSTVTEPLAAFTLNVTSLAVLPSRVVTTAVVPRPLTKFTVSYGFTKSRDSPLFCKFQPAFNTSDTVAALLPIYLGFVCPSFVFGFANAAASSAVNGALLIFSTSPVFSVPSGFVIVLEPSFTFGMLFFTFFNVVGLVVPSGPLIDVTTSPFGTSAPDPSGFSKNLTSSLPVFGSVTVLGYTLVPSAFV